MDSLNQSTPWSIEDALSLYLIDRWGAGYFDVNENGHLTVAPMQAENIRLSLFEVLETAREEGMSTPLLLRFQDLLRHRVRAINTAFRTAIDAEGYQGRYRGVYPIKANQLREVVEEILDAGQEFSFGIEVGSKAELYAGLAIHQSPDTLMVCNGYKDRDYVQMALLGTKLGKKVILVIEKVSETETIIQTAQEMEVTPLLGVRVRLHAMGAGRWASSSGQRAKFGLSTSEILNALDRLKSAGLGGTVKLLHFHIGSQIPDILRITSAVREACRYYAKLHKAGHPIQYLDVGGGLAIDYDGSRTSFHSSMNYTLEEYAREVTHTIKTVCDAENVAHPDIVSESGRAIAAHHSVLIVEAFGAISKSPPEESSRPKSEHRLVRGLEKVRTNLSTKNLIESLHKLVQINDEAQKMFELGLLDLADSAAVEVLYWEVTEAIQRLAAQLPQDELPEELFALEQLLAGQHICNFSVFQSLVDHWALGQLFPIAPIHRLNEQPLLQSTLVDITCDSDGKVSKFIDTEDVRETLPLHTVSDEPYYLGIFLTGAYQDIMGDIHNLFGRVGEAHVFLDEDEEGGYYIEERIEGSTLSDVLALTQYDNRDLAKQVKAQIDEAIRIDRLRPKEGMRLLARYKAGLNGQTYLELGLNR